MLLRPGCVLSPYHVARFQEDSENPIVGTLYVQKHALKSRPDNVEVTVKAKDKVRSHEVQDWLVLESKDFSFTGHSTGRIIFPNAASVSKLGRST